MVARGPAQGRGPGATGPEAPLVGRDAELAALADALGSAGGLVLIAGEAGLGKTRLVREIARLAEADGRPTVWGRPEQVTAPGPFALVLDLVENLIGRTRDPASASDERALVGRLLDPHEWGGAGSPPVREIAARLRGFLSELGARPVAIFEDLHAADAASHAVVAHLAHSAADDGHLLIGTYRPEEQLASEDALGRFLALVTREHLAREIVLKPLDSEASAALATRALGGAPAGGLERIVALAEGVPFFIEELAAAGAREVESVPNTIARAVVARRRQLGEDAQRVVVAASLAPGWIDPDVLAEALGRGRDAVAAALAAAVRAGLLEDREGRVVFRHALVRESVRADLVSVEAEELNRRLGAATERVYAGRLEPHAKALSHYWYQGRDRDRAKRYALLAGERALALAAAQDARESYELALGCADGDAPDALLGLAEADIREGRSGEVESLLRRAADALVGEGRRADAARALARLAWVLSVGRPVEAPVSVVDEGLALVSEEEHGSDVARLLAVKGQILMFWGRAAEGIPFLERAAEMAARAGDPAVRAESLDTLSWAADQEFRVREALALADEACRHALTADEAEAVGRTHNNAAQLLALHGHTEDALRLLDTAREHLAGSYGRGGVAIIDLTEAITRWYRGEPGRVARLVARGEVGWARWRTWTRVLQAWSSLHLGDRERARATVGRCWEEIGAGSREEAESAEGMDVERSNAAVCDLLVRLEDGEGGGLPLAESLLAFSRPSPGRHLHAAPFAARAALQAGDLRRAREIVEDARGVAARYPAPLYAGLLLEIEGLLAGDDPAAAEDLFRGAAAAIESGGNLVDRARALRLAGERAGEAGARDRAIEGLKSARELAFQAGSQLEVARAESALRAHGVRPRAGRPRKGRDSAGTLSTREEEVTALVAAGATNAEIAGRLYLSERTVQDHITHALRKVGVQGRAGLAAWAAKQGLV